MSACPLAGHRTSRQAIPDLQLSSLSFADFLAVSITLSV
jgi:hypothetical protein